MQLTRSMACDWAKYNIRVNNILPGYFKAPMSQKSWTDPERASDRARRCMLGRWGNPEELVGPVIFLVSEASSYITGNDLFVDGGLVNTG
jgi:NAD(P)-dependent dehydrogenase (short-subunit alcohol dehydrogenase family)